MSCAATTRPGHATPTSSTGGSALGSRSTSWSTTSNARLCPVEAKAVSRVRADHAKGLRELKADHPETGRRIVVSFLQQARRSVLSSPSRRSLIRWLPVPDYRTVAGTTRGTPSPDLLTRSTDPRRERHGPADLRGVLPTSRKLWAVRCAGRSPRPLVVQGLRPVPRPNARSSSHFVRVLEICKDMTARSVGPRWRRCCSGRQRVAHSVARAQSERWAVWRVRVVSGAWGVRGRAAFARLR